MESKALKEFLVEENQGAVLRLRRGWGDEEAELQEAIKIGRRWADHISAEHKGAFESSPPLDELPRLITMDVERTFCQEDNRLMMCDFMSRFERRVGDYHQSTTFCAAVLYMLLPKAQAFELVLTLASREDYLKDFWFKRKRFGTEAFTFDTLLAKHMPEVHAHLKKWQILPEAYTQRWFLALTINVIPYRFLIRVLDAFFKKGNRVLLAFGLSFCHFRREELLAANDTSALFAILRNEPVPSDELLERIVDGTLNEVFELGSNDDLAALREQVFQDNIERLEPAPRDDAEDDSSSLLDSDEEEDGPECLVCHENMPEVYCEECELLFCDACLAAHAPHQTSHKVDKTLDEWDYDKLLALCEKLKE